MIVGLNCPDCEHHGVETVAAHVAGHGSLRTFAVRECQRCGMLWGEERDFYGVIE